MQSSCLGTMSLERDMWRGLAQNQSGPPQGEGGPAGDSGYWQQLDGVADLGGGALLVHCVAVHLEAQDHLHIRSTGI